MPNESPKIPKSEPYSFSNIMSNIIHGFMRGQPTKPITDTKLPTPAAQQPNTYQTIKFESTISQLSTNDIYRSLDEFKSIQHNTFLINGVKYDTCRFNAAARGVDVVAVMVKVTITHAGSSVIRIIRNIFKDESAGLRYKMLSNLDLNSATDVLFANLYLKAIGTDIVATCTDFTIGDGNYDDLHLV